MSNDARDELCINAVRFLAIDAVERAHSGHPGTPMGAAGLAYVLWDRFLKHNPADPAWPDRDRFVLSAGHASMLLYALLHLTGYAVSLDDLRQFRSWGSITPGHPEHGLTPGVEATAGPLGQGFANGVGMAIAERRLAQCFNRPGYPLFDHYTFALVSDGDLQEGLASEAASLAGTLKLGKLIYLYDSNGVQQDGPTVSFREDVAERFRAYGWSVAGPIDGLDLAAVDLALRAACAVNDKPHLIICRTTIGYGSPHKAGTSEAHGKPLGQEEVRLTRLNLNWPYAPFSVPQEVYEHMLQAGERGSSGQAQWQELLENYRQAYPREAGRLDGDLRGELPRDWQKGLDGLFANINKPLSTREASGQVLEILSENVPALTGGAADLAESTRTYLKDTGDLDANSYSGRNIRYGLREHAMAAISNGLALHGGLMPFAATFLVFSDYLRPSLRLAAIMKLRVIFVFTHDSIGVGEDGPTHQPVEQLMSLRLIPGLVTLRPGGPEETLEAWKVALTRKEGPTALILSRQSLPAMGQNAEAAEGVKRGAYVLRETGLSPRVVLMGTGSEVPLALEAGEILRQKGIAARVVSLPSWELFAAQPEDYRRRVLPPEIKARVSIEAGTTMGWERYVGEGGKALGIDSFGASAPGEELFQRFGLTSHNIVEEALKLVSGITANTG
jgi:transketolase